MARRIIAVITAVVLIMTVFPAVGVSAELDKREADRISLLQQLGFIDEYEAKANVSRGQFIDAITMITGSSLTPGIYFKTYMRDEAVRFSEVLPVLIDLTGNSYKLKTIAAGMSLDKQYMYTANKIGLTDGISYMFDQTVDMENYVKLIYNALVKTTVSTARSYDGSVVYAETDRTLMEHRMDMVAVSGMVNAAGNLSLYSDRTVEDGQIMIGQTVYYYDHIQDEDEYIGRYVTAYLNKNDMSTVCAVIVSELKNEIVELEGDYVGPATANSITYNDVKKKVKYNLEDDVDVVYNGRLEKWFNPEIFKTPGSALTLIDNDDDEKYEVVIIEKYTSIVVANINTSRFALTDSKGNTYDITEFVENNYPLMNAKEEPQEVSIIQQNNVLSIRRSLDGDITKMYVERKKVSGVLENQKENYKYIFIDGVEYECTYECYDEASKENNIHVGDTVQVYLDAFGKVAYIHVDDAVRRLGYIMKLTEADAMGKARVKILDEDNKFVYADIINHVMVNGQKVSVDSLSGTALYADRVFASQLIEYTISEDGRIKNIVTAKNESANGSRGYEGLTLNYNSSDDGGVICISSSGYKLLASKYIIDGDTKIFTVNTADDLVCSVLPGTSFEVNSDIRHVRLYNVDNNFHVKVVVVGKAREEYWGGYASAYVVDDVFQKINNYGEPQYYISLWRNGEKLEYPIVDGEITPALRQSFSGDTRLESVPIKNVRRGSMIGIQQNEDGIYYYGLITTPFDDNSEVMFEKIPTNNTGGSYGISSTLFNGSNIFSFGEVVGITDYGIIVNNHIPTAEETASGLTFPIEAWNRHMPGKTRVYFYYKSRDILEVGSVLEVVVGDKIAIQQNYSAYAYIVYRD